MKHGGGLKGISDSRVVRDAIAKCNRASRYSRPMHKPGRQLNGPLMEGVL